MSKRVREKDEKQPEHRFEMHREAFQHLKRMQGVEMVMKLSEMITFSIETENLSDAGVTQKLGEKLQEIENEREETHCAWAEEPVFYYADGIEMLRMDLVVGSMTPS